MTTINSNDLATINAALSPAMQGCIGSMESADLRQRRGIDFELLARAEAAAERLVATHGADNWLAIPGTLAGLTPAGLLAQVRDVAAQAEPHRPKARRS